MSTQTNSTSNSLGDGLSKSTKTLIAAIVGIVVIIGGYFGYKEFVAKPNVEKGAAALFHAEHWFEMDSLQYVLDGDGQNDGALYVIDKYGSTPAGNQARLYAGMAYLKLGDFDNAIKHLEAFDGQKTPVTYTVYGSIGDAYMEKGEVDKGISYYKKAAEFNDEAIAPLYLYRVAKAYALNGKNEEAIEAFKKLKTDFPFSQQGRDADKELGVLGVTE